MTKSQVEIGKMYAVKVSGRIAPVKLTGESPYGGWYGKNVITGRDIRIRSAAKLRYECNGQGYPLTALRCGQCDNCQAVAERKTRVKTEVTVVRVSLSMTSQAEAEIISAWREFCNTHPCTRS